VVSIPEEERKKKGRRRRKKEKEEKRQLGRILNFNIIISLLHCSIVHYKSFRVPMLKFLNFFSFPLKCIPTTIVTDKGILFHIIYIQYNVNLNLIFVIKFLIFSNNLYIIIFIRIIFYSLF